MESVLAQTNVVFAREGRVARSAQGLYLEKTGTLELTGQPTAIMPEGQITEAERLIWDRLHERFAAKGKFKSEWTRPAKSTNHLDLPLPPVR